MNRNKYVLLLIPLLLCVPIFNPGQSRTEHAPKNANRKKCSRIIDGLKFCTTSPEIVSKLGENVPIDLSLQNLGKREIKIVTAEGFERLYKLNVINPDGKKLLSRREQREAKQEKGKITAEDLLAMPVNGGSFDQILKPKEELKIQYNLNYFYDFTARGKYIIQIARTVFKADGSSNTELTLEGIEIEIK